MLKLFALFFISSLTFSQVVFTSLDDEVYSFLERMTLKGVIEFHSQVKPIPRMEVGKYLNEIKSSIGKLSALDKEELDFYISKYALETGELTKESYYLFGYTDSLFALRIKPNIGLGIRTFGSETSTIKWPGVSFYGYAGDNFGAFFEYVDYGEEGRAIDRLKRFTPNRGYKVNNSPTPSTIEYSDIRGTMAYSWNWGYVSIGKDYNTWGSGKYGQIILSDKPASYPNIRMFFNPVPWFRFHYMAGSVNSLVIDSSSIQMESPSSSIYRQRKGYLPKYVVANLVSVTPWEGIDISLGNSYTYAGPFRLETLIPFLYYKGTDHNFGRGGEADGNGMIFSDFQIRKLDKTLFYASFLIDVLNLRDLLDGDFSKQWVAFTFGAKRIDAFLPNLDITAEYTRLNPWLYENRDQASNYKHIDYPLGDWMGQNADRFRFQIDYKYFRQLKHSLYTEFIRKGEIKDIYYAYDSKLRADDPVVFLSPVVRKEFRIGFSTIYEPYFGMSAKFNYEYSSVTDNLKTRTPNYLLGDNHNFSLIVSYSL